MSIIPLHLQRRFEQRWAARFGSLVMPAEPMPSRHGRLSYPIGPAEAQRRDGGRQGGNHAMVASRRIRPLAEFTTGHSLA
jgi:hypothetical protein